MFPILSILALIIVAVLLLLVLFEPGLRYRVTPPPHPMDSEHFLCVVGALSDSQVHRDSFVDVLTNGSVFYEAQLEAIRAAKRSINMEAYIFRKDEISHRFIEALTERGRE